MADLFEDRSEAGRRLARRLQHLGDRETVALGIPRGGIPVAAEVARALGLQWGVLPVRKLPIPFSPEAGFGAVALDGSIVINDAMVSGLRLSRAQMDEVIGAVKAEVERRAAVFYAARPPVDITGRSVVVVDDGLAGGYTMMAAIKSVRAQGCGRVVAVAPVASRSAAALVGPAADECVFEVVSAAVPFAVADFYLRWRDLTDDDVIPVLRD